MTRRRLRILAIGHSYVVRLNRGIPRILAGRGDLDLTVAAPRFFHGDLRRLELEPEFPDSPLKVVGLRAHCTRSPHLFGYDSGDLARLLAEGDFDAVHAWEEPFVFAGAQIARALAHHRAGFCFRTAQNLIKWYPPPFSFFERTTRARAQRWIAGGELVFRAMVQHGFPGAEGRMLPLGVDTGLFHPDPDHGADVRARLGLEGPVIGFLGRLTEEKGVLHLLKSLERLHGRWSLLLLGSGPLEGTVRRWAIAHQAEHQVKQLLVTHEQVPEYLPAVNVLAAPSQTTRSWREQFGRMLVEAFACGVPVVASDSGEIPFVLGDAGRSVDEHDVTGWTRTLDEVLSNPSLQNDLAERGLERARTLYSHEALASSYATLYQELATEGARA